MEFTFTNGSSGQHQTFLSAVGALLNYDISKAPGGTVTVSFVPDPNPEVHNEFAWTSNGTIEIRTDFPSLAPTALWGSAGFAAELVVHEVAHVILDSVPIEARRELGGLFGFDPFLEGDVYESENDTKEWVDRQREGFCETFKDAFLPPSMRAYSNRTNIKCPVHHLPRFREIMRGIAAAGQINIYVEDELTQIYTRELLETDDAYTIIENTPLDLVRLGGYDNSQETPNNGLFSLYSSKVAHPTIPNNSYMVIQAFSGLESHVDSVQYGSISDTAVTSHSPMVPAGTYVLDWTWTGLRDLLDDMAMSQHSASLEGQVQRFQIVTDLVFYEQNVYFDAGFDPISGLSGFGMTQLLTWHLNPSDTTNMTFVGTDAFGRDCWRLYELGFDGFGNQTTSLSITPQRNNSTVNVPGRTWSPHYMALYMRSGEMVSPYTDHNDVREDMAAQLAAANPQLLVDGDIWFPGSEAQDAPARSELKSGDKAGASQPTRQQVHGGGDDFLSAPRLVYPPGVSAGEG